MSSRYEEVLERIDAFLAELDLLVRQAALQSIQLALSGEPAPESITAAPEPPESETPEMPTTTGRVRARRRFAELAGPKERTAAKSTSSPSGRRAVLASREVPRRKGAGAGGKRNAKQLGALMDSALKYIHRHPGSRMEQIAEGMGIPSRELTLPLRHLKSEGRLKTKGQKRATSYFAK